jgi:hypothetical protein
MLRTLISGARAALARLQTLEDGSPRFRLHDDWWQLLLHAWSSRLLIAMFLINAVDASYAYFIGYAPLPPWAMGLLTSLISMITLWARVTVQKKLAATPPKGNNNAGT